MRAFSNLILQLDATTRINPKVEALVDFFRSTDDEDRLWAIGLLAGKKPKRSINTRLLREWTAQASEIPLWLFEDSYHIVGDLAETCALLAPEPSQPTDRSLSYWMSYLDHLRGLDDEGKKESLMKAWDQLERPEKFAFHKLITGGFRIGVSQKLMTRALAKFTGKEEAVLAHRLMGNWTPSTTTYHDLIEADRLGDDLSLPYPFYLAYPLEEEPNSLGSASEWIAERKWDGIRGQLIRRKEEVFVWSRGEELVTDQYPELLALGQALPEGTVLDGEIMAHDGQQALPFNLLQKRIGRKRVGPKSLADAPVKLIAYDLLEWEGHDWRQIPFEERRKQLENLVTQLEHPVLLLSERVPFQDWNVLAEEREGARAHKAEGLMLKRADSIYQVGRKRGDWWKWKMDPLTIDAVLIYAMRGHGRRANLYTDYTFAVRDGDRLVPFTKAYSGLTDAELKEVDRFVKKNTLERFGPVRSVEPELVMEIAFEGIARSSRHKSGIALRFPRIHRWRKDKPSEEVNTLADLQALLKLYES
ncbi:ATP-dependent DNA ligase [Cryomorphaceae bacterium]|nr:ATP-dependent DNA ligase [Cryomorphaceae bacterium]